MTTLIGSLQLVYQKQIMQQDAIVEKRKPLLEKKGSK